MQEEKIKIRKTFIEDKCRNLYSLIGSFKKLCEMTNDEARLTIKESKDWERKFDEIVNLWQMYFEESITLDNESDRQTVWAVVDDLCLAINSNVDSLYIEDEGRGLYSRSENKAKDTLMPSMVFLGIMSTNL